ncbi:hypothetical protein BKA63DRAFT_497443 [Paraphoma chrysanthemicola]|nr:hypothetical protein BKA63DRAFT_497443 [Paraphoma chrysanthemicola]
MISSSEMPNTSASVKSNVWWQFIGLQIDPSAPAKSKKNVPLTEEESEPSLDSTTNVQYKHDSTPPSATLRKSNIHAKNGQRDDAKRNESTSRKAEKRLGQAIHSVARDAVAAKDAWEGGSVASIRSASDASANTSNSGGNGEIRGTTNRKAFVKTKTALRHQQSAATRKAGKKIEHEASEDGGVRTSHRTKQEKRGYRE